MMQRHIFNNKIKQLKITKLVASPDEQLEIDFTIFGMQWAIGDGDNEKLHEKRMNLLMSEHPTDRKKGIAYRKGMDIVLYSVRGKKSEPKTVMLPTLRVHEDVERGLINIKKHFRFRNLATVRKSALRWYVEMMSEKHGEDFFK